MNERIVKGIEERRIGRRTEEEKIDWERNIGKGRKIDGKGKREEDRMNERMGRKMREEGREEYSIRYNI